MNIKFKANVSKPILLTVLFVSLKLVNCIDWNWYWVFSPIWLFLTFCLFLFFISFVLK